MLKRDSLDNIFSVIYKHIIFQSLRISLFKAMHSFVNALRYCWSFVLGEEECLRCGEKSGFVPICKSCLQKKNQLHVERCGICGKELVSEICICSSCRRERILENVDFSYPLYSYRLWHKNLLFAWKSEKKRTLSPIFASMLYEKIKDLSCDESNLLKVVPVPPRPGKIKCKGWDQIEELCFYLRNLYGIKILPLLRRTTSLQQKKLDKKHRLEQTKRAFVLCPKNKLRRFLRNLPEKVVLIDDVMTTGSTIEACAAELKRAGIKKVYAVTLFIAD